MHSDCSASLRCLPYMQVTHQTAFVKRSSDVGGLAKFEKGMRLSGKTTYV